MQMDPLHYTRAMKCTIDLGCGRRRVEPLQLVVRIVQSSVNQAMHCEKRHHDAV